MARPRTHSDEQILSAVRTLLLTQGPRGVTTAAVSQVSGAPTGTLYHRFGSRSNMVAELWIRTVRRLHEAVFLVAESAEPGLEKAVAMALATVDFSVANLDDARLLTLASRERLQHDSKVSAANRQALQTLNHPLLQHLRHLAAEFPGAGEDAAHLRTRLTFAVVSIPYIAVRQALDGRSDLAVMRPLTEQAVRAVLDPAAGGPPVATALSSGS